MTTYRVDVYPYLFSKIKQDYELPAMWKLSFCILAPEKKLNGDSFVSAWVLLSSKDDLILTLHLLIQDISPWQKLHERVVNSPRSTDQDYFMLLTAIKMHIKNSALSFFQRLRSCCPERCQRPGKRMPPPTSEEIYTLVTQKTIRNMILASSKWFLILLPVFRFSGLGNFCVW